MTEEEKDAILRITGFYHDNLVAFGAVVVIALMFWVELLLTR